MSEEFNNKDQYPQWLIDKAFDNWFDWDEGIYTTFSRFLEFATLHDSYWCGLYSNLDNSVNLVINFDAFWNKDMTNHPGENVNEWPYLIIRLERVYNLVLNSNMDCGDTVGDAKSELIAEEQIEKLIDSISQQSIINPLIAENIIGKRIVRTKIEDVCGGFIEAIHSERIRILLYNSEGVIIDLPKELVVKKEE